MIVRNEAGIIEDAIASTQGLADEVVALDTGSTDGTPELLEQLGCRVLRGGARMHKAQSRNRAIETAKGEWIVILDADEQIADPVGLRAFLERTDAGAVYIRLAYMDANDEPTLEYSQMRCWRKGMIWYRYRAHEVPLPDGKWPALAHTDFVWEHRPPRDRTWKLQYTLDRLLMDVEEHPDDPRPMYYLGRQYLYARQYEKAIEWLQRYIDTTGKADRADAWYCMAQCCGATGNRRGQIRCLHMAWAENPSRREWVGSLAQIYHDNGQDQVAVGLLKAALEIPPPKKSYYNHTWHGPHIYDLLARCLWKLGRVTEGRAYMLQAVALAPNDTRLRSNLAHFVESGGT